MTEINTICINGFDAKLYFPDNAEVVRYGVGKQYTSGVRHFISSRASHRDEEGFLAAVGGANHINGIIVNGELVAWEAGDEWSEEMCQRYMDLKAEERKRFEAK